MSVQQIPENPTFIPRPATEPSDVVLPPARTRPQAPPTSVLVREILETLLFTFFVIWFVKSATQNFRIEGASMLPTLHEGQYLIINKLAYLTDEPERGDIIVHHYPNDRSRDFIKRIVGLPGDTVIVENGRVSVNGVEINEPYIKDPPTNNQTWHVAADEFFVMGDNRRNSSDSRAWDPLPRSDIIGEAWVIYWPPQDWQFVPHYPHTAVPDRAPPPPPAEPLP